jgi:hypothetical protein
MKAIKSLIARLRAALKRGAESGDHRLRPRSIEETAWSS